MSETSQTLEPGAVGEGRVPPGGCGLCGPMAGFLSSYAGSPQKVSDMSGDGPDGPLRAAALVRRALETSKWAVGERWCRLLVLTCRGVDSGPPQVRFTLGLGRCTNIKVSL